MDNTPLLSICIILKLDFDDAPLSSYDMQVGGRHTRVIKDHKTGKMKVSQSVVSPSFCWCAYMLYSLY